MSIAKTNKIDSDVFSRRKMRIKIRDKTEDALQRQQQFNKQIREVEQYQDPAEYTGEHQHRYLHEEQEMDVTRATSSTNSTIIKLRHLIATPINPFLTTATTTTINLPHASYKSITTAEGASSTTTTTTPLIITAAAVVLSAISRTLMASTITINVRRREPNVSGPRSVSPAHKNPPLLLLLLLLVTTSWCTPPLHVEARSASRRITPTSTSTTSRTTAAATGSIINGYPDSYEIDYPPELRPRIPLEPLHDYRIFLQKGRTEDDLPICSSNSVCNKISTYSTPYAERMCRCPRDQRCSTSLDTNDGFTVVDKDSQFKLCDPVKKLPQCKFFSEVSYTMIFYPDNITQLIAHCICPKNAVTYVVHKDPYRTSKGYGYFYSFACSPLELVCKRKEPCRLFSARKRSDFEEVTTTILCRCPSNRSCPSHHTEHGVVPGKLYKEDPVRTYSGYCV